MVALLKKESSVVYHVEIRGARTTPAVTGPILNLHVKFQFPSPLGEGEEEEINEKQTQR